MRSATTFFFQATAPRAFQLSAAVLLLCAATVGSSPAMAQQPTAAQRGAIKSSCRADFIANCSGVSPGGLPALQCLKQHRASLSQPCQKAVDAIKG
jgi:hypothetical protein